MRQENWMELQSEAPLAVNTCLNYFQDRYMGNWRTKILDPGAVFTYLQTVGFEITVSTFGIPNRSDWYCEVYYQGQLLKHERDFISFELAALEAITTAFGELERTFTHGS